MELAMHCRDSGDRLASLASYGSEWTVGVCRCQLDAAFLGCVRQQMLGFRCEELRKKVASLRVGVIAFVREPELDIGVAAHALFEGLASLFSVGCRA